MWSQRSVVDYALARRAQLTSYSAGRVPRAAVCDASVYLLRAARYHGEPAGDECPICSHQRRREPLVHVTYTYGDCFRADTNGRARPTRDLPELAHTYDEFTVWVVEVCMECGWNHLVTSYVLGTGRDAARGRRRARGR